MSREPDKQLLTALDIGTSKVVAIVAEVNEFVGRPIDTSQR